jgi:peptide/nickel transport system ATP-binding protein
MAALLDIEGLRTHFFTSRGVVRAVDGVSFAIGAGEIVGLVGESGSGKSMTALSVLGLVRPPGRIVAGRILFQGEDLLQRSESEMRSLRGKRISMIFQDPVSFLDPVFPVGNAIAEALVLHTGLTMKAALAKAVELLHALKVPSPERVVSAYPFQLSGGMCQRVLIATAIASKPDLLIADEATSGLDVTVQASILRTLQELRDSSGTAILVTTHHTQVVRKICTRTIVMYAGRIMETGRTEEVLQHPLHPYTIGLLNSMPRPERRGETLSAIPGEPPKPGSLLPGCVFEPRCRYRRAACVATQPPLVEVAPGHLSACPYLPEAVGHA